MSELNKAETEWFLENIQPHQEYLKSWLRKRFSSLENIDDIVQESYIKTLKRHRRKYLKHPRAFLFATAHNLCIDCLRRRRIIKFESIDHENVVNPAGNQKGIAEGVVEKEELEILHDTIQSLPKRCRQVFTLRKVYGMSLKQISAELGISVKTVETQISIGICKCSKIYKRIQRTGSL